MKIGPNKLSICILIPLMVWIFGNVNTTNNFFKRNQSPNDIQVISIKEMTKIIGLANSDCRGPVGECKPYCASICDTLPDCECDETFLMCTVKQGTGQECGWWTDNPPFMDIQCICEGDDIEHYPCCHYTL